MNTCKSGCLDCKRKLQQIEEPEIKTEGEINPAIQNAPVEADMVPVLKSLRRVTSEQPGYQPGLTW
jgi:hypothetical protein